MYPADTFNESVSSIIERKVRGWLGGVIDDMRRSSPVQQWLDSLPSDTNPSDRTDEAPEVTEPKSEDTKTDQTVIDNTIIDSTDKTIVEPLEIVDEDKSLEVPNAKEVWKRKSLESGMLTSTPQSVSQKKLQRDHSVQSEGYVPKFKNPLLRDHSLQVTILKFKLDK